MLLLYLRSLSSITCKQDPHGGIGSFIKPLLVKAVTAIDLIAVLGYFELA